MGTVARHSPLILNADAGLYRSTLTNQFDLITAENEMKFSESTRPSQAQFSYAKANEIVAFARSKNQKVHGHVLVWGNKSVVPRWFQNLSTDSVSTASAKKLSAMLEHIRTTISHFKNNFPGVVVSWDVVNEAVGSGGGVRNSIDDPFTAIGGDNNRDAYIYHAFLEARRVDPNAQLFYNDYGFEAAGIKQNGIYSLLQKLKSQGMPIHGIGLQGHYKADSPPPSIATLRTTIQRFATLGLTFRFSEIDVRVHNADGISPQETANQSQYYYNVVRACVLEPSCVGVSTWGFTARHSWIEDQNNTSTQPAFGYTPFLPFNASYNKTSGFSNMTKALTD